MHQRTWVAALVAACLAACGGVVEGAPGCPPESRDAASEAAAVPDAGTADAPADGGPDVLGCPPGRLCPDADVSDADAAPVDAASECNRCSCPPEGAVCGFPSDASVD